MSELEAIIHQSMVDKVVKSVDYPYTIFEHKRTYEGFTEEVDQNYDSAEIPSEEFFNKISENLAIAYNKDYSFSEVDEELERNFLDNLSELRENFKECRNAHNAFSEYTTNNPDTSLTWDGPSIDELDTLITSIDNYGDNTNKFAPLLSLVKFTALVTRITVKVQEPDFELNGKRFDLNNLTVIPSGSGEVWAKYKWFKCTRRTRIGGICYRWRWTTRNTRILKISLALRVKVSAHAKVIPENSLVKIYGEFDKLRLDHTLLRIIPLEKLANGYLGKKPLVIFDAGQFVKTIPVLKKDFKVSKIEIPNDTGKVNVKISIKQV